MERGAMLSWPHYSPPLAPKYSADFTSYWSSRERVDGLIVHAEWVCVCVCVCVCVFHQFIDVFWFNLKSFNVRVIQMLKRLFLLRWKHFLLHRRRELLYSELFCRLTAAETSNLCVLLYKINRLLFMKCRCFPGLMSFTSKREACPPPPLSLSLSLLYASQKKCSRSF